VRNPLCLQLCERFFYHFSTVCPSTTGVNEGGSKELALMHKAGQGWLFCPTMSSRARELLSYKTRTYGAENRAVDDAKNARYNDLRDRYAAERAAYHRSAWPNR
jgi:hypothetical protein